MPVDKNLETKVEIIIIKKADIIKYLVDKFIYKYVIDFTK